MDNSEDPSVKDESVVEPPAGVPSNAKASPEESEGGKLRINIWLRRSLLEAVKEIAEASEHSTSDVIRDAVRDYVKRVKSGEVEP